MWYPQARLGLVVWPAASPRTSSRPPPRGPEAPPQYSQAVDHSAPLPPVVLLLPLLQAPDHFEQRALGGGRVPVGGPADVLEMLDYAVPVLRLRTGRLLVLFPQMPWGLQHCRGKRTQGHLSHRRSPDSSPHFCAPGFSPHDCPAPRIAWNTYSVFKTQSRCPFFQGKPSLTQAEFASLPEAQAPEPVAFPH